MDGHRDRAIWTVIVIGQACVLAMPFLLFAPSVVQIPQDMKVAYIIACMIQLTAYQIVCLTIEKTLGNEE